MLWIQLERCPTCNFCRWSSSQFFAKFRNGPILLGVRNIFPTIQHQPLPPKTSKHNVRNNHNTNQLYENHRTTLLYRFGRSVQSTTFSVIRILLSTSSSAGKYSNSVLTTTNTTRWVSKRRISEKLTGGTGLIKGRVKGPKKRTIIQSAIGTKTKTAKGVVESHKITKAIMRQVAPVISQTASKDVAARTQAARMARLDFGTQKSKRMRQQQIPVVRAGRSLAIEVESTTSNPGLPPTETSNVVGKSSWMAPASFVAPVSRVDAMEKSKQSVFANEMMVSLEQSSEQLLQQRRLEELQRIERLQRLGTTKLRIPKTKPSGNVFAALDDDSSDSETPRGESEFKRVFKAPTLTSAGTLVPEKELEHKYYNPSDVTVKIAPPTFMFNPHVHAKGAKSTNVDEDDDDL